MKGKKILSGVTLGLLGLGVVSGATFGDVKANDNPQISEKSTNLSSDVKKNGVTKEVSSKLATRANSTIRFEKMVANNLYAKNYVHDDAGVSYDDEFYCCTYLNFKPGFYYVWDRCGYEFNFKGNAPVDYTSENWIHELYGDNIQLVSANELVLPENVDGTGMLIYVSSEDEFSIAYDLSSNDLDVCFFPVFPVNSNNELEISECQIGEYEDYISINDYEWAVNDETDEYYDFVVPMEPGMYAFWDITGYYFNGVGSQNGFESGMDCYIYGDNIYKVNYDFEWQEYVMIYVPNQTNIHFVYNTLCDDFTMQIADVTGTRFFEDYQIPTISGTNNFVVNINDRLSKEEILSHITATDETDGNVPVYFKECDYDPQSSGLGEYNAVIGAKDKAGNEATYNIVIHVVDIDKPSYASGQTSYTTNYKTEILLETIKNALKFNDNVDNTFTLNITNDNYSANKNIVGTYYVKVTATDKSGNVSDEVTVTINVVDDVNPSISGETTIQANSNKKLSESEILANFTATDEYCGTADLSIVNYDVYSNKYNVVGDYKITIKAIDDYGNSVTKEVTIHVNDKNKPTFTSGTQSYEVSYDSPVTLETIKDSLIFTDDVDDELTITVTSDNYSANKNIVGTYYVKVTATDKSGNVSDEVTVTVKVYDRTKPVISAPGTIDAGNNTMVTLEEIKGKISINDGLDGAITNFTIDGYEEYQAKYNVVGNYTLTISASDANGNKATATITIKVADKIAPEIVFDDYFIVLDEGQELTSEQIKNMASKVLGIDVESITEIEGEYDTNKVGTYNLSVKTVSGDVYNFTLSVDANYDDTAQYRALKWYEYIYIWFSIFFNFQDGYETESFWDFSTRCSYISEVYSTGKLRLPKEEKHESNDVETSVEEVVFKGELGDYTIEF